MTEPFLTTPSPLPPAPVRRRWGWWAAGGLVVLLIASCVLAWHLLYRTNVPAAVDGPAYLYIRRGVGLRAVLDSLHRPGQLNRPETFARVASWCGYGTPARPVQPGRYTLPAGLGNLALVELLASGRQDTLTFTLKPVNYLPQLPRQAGCQLNLDTAQLHKLLANNAYLVSRYGLDTATIRTLFIPGTLRLFWPTPAPVFLDSVAARHQRFWTPRRLAEADSLGMSKVQVAVLASIVQRETAQPTDKPIIAGVYLNRLRRGQPLQADPTLLWPLHGLGTRKRVLNVDKKVDSPYNTYRHKGLPPGPITTPYPQALDAVLRPAHHNYVFFCARPDGSGFSDFAVTFAEHKLNARRFQHHLDSLKIKR
jgi:UPF0755 protein